MRLLNGVGKHRVGFYKNAKWVGVDWLGSELYGYSRSLMGGFSRRYVPLSFFFFASNSN